MRKPVVGRKRGLLGACLLLSAVACGQNPVSPGDSTPAEGSALPGARRSGSILTAKPPTGQTLTVTFVDPPTIGYSIPPDPRVWGTLPSGILGGPATVSGSVSGTSGSRLIKVTSGSATLTVLDVVPTLSPYQDSCNETLKLALTSAHLLGAPLTGALTLTVDELQKSDTFHLDNISALGSTYHITGNSTGNFPARIDETSLHRLTITQNYGDIFIAPDRKNLNLPATSGCRAYWSIVIDLP